MSRYAMPSHTYCGRALSLLGRYALVLLLPSLMLLTGCGKSGPKSTVSGKVLFKGEPVMGTVSFIGADGKEASGPISPDGTYIVTDPPLGDDKITVKGMGGPGMPAPTRAPKPPPELAKNMPAPAPMPVPPPAKYANPANGLTFKVTGGKQTFDIELK